MVGYLTRVTLGNVPGGMHISVQFGVTVKRTTCQQGGATSVYFVPNTVFCLAHRPSGVQQAKHTLIEVLRAVAPGERCSQVAGVLPGAEILLRVTDAANVNRLFALIRAIEAQHVHPGAVSFDYWRAVHNRIAASIDLIPFSVAAHAAGARRRRLSP